ncbi:MAG: hypothetical protein ABL958_10760 [Bdellovibrionia bacterium]
MNIRLLLSVSVAAIHVVSIAAWAAPKNGLVAGAARRIQAKATQAFDGRIPVVSGRGRMRSLPEHPVYRKSQVNDKHSGLLPIILEAVESSASVKAGESLGPHIGLLKVPRFASSVKSLPHEKVTQVVAELGDRIHGNWQDGARKEGKVERYKPIKIDGNTITSEVDLQSYLTQNDVPRKYSRRYKMQTDGNGNLIAYEDILNIPNRFLGPNNQAENTVSAYLAVVFADRWIARGGEIDPKFMHAASTFVHDQWMERNKWAKESNPTVFKPFDQLNSVEAKKDIDIVNDALDLYYRRQVPNKTNLDVSSNSGGSQ